MNSSSSSSLATGRSLESGNSILASFLPSSRSSSRCGPLRNSSSDLRTVAFVVPGSLKVVGDGNSGLLDLDSSKVCFVVSRSLLVGSYLVVVSSCVVVVNVGLICVVVFASWVVIRVAVVGLLPIVVVVTSFAVVVPPFVARHGGCGASGQVCAAHGHIGVAHFSL